MKAQIKKIVKATASSLLSITSKNKIGRYWRDQVISMSMEDTTEVRHASLHFKFAAPNSLCRFRSDTFSTKEPETLE